MELYLSPPCFRDSYQGHVSVIVERLTNIYQVVFSNLLSVDGGKKPRLGFQDGFWWRLSHQSKMKCWKWMLQWMLEHQNSHLKKNRAENHFSVITMKYFHRGTSLTVHGAQHRAPTEVNPTPRLTDLSSNPTTSRSRTFLDYGRKWSWSKVRNSREFHGCVIVFLWNLLHNLRQWWSWRLSLRVQWEKGSYSCLTWSQKKHDNLWHVDSSRQRKKKKNSTSPVPVSETLFPSSPH